MADEEDTVQLATLRVRGARRPVEDDGADVVQWKQTAGWGGSVRNMKDHLKKEWDSLLWIFAAFSILYYTEFASNLIFNPKIDWTYMTVCVLSLVVCLSSLLYLSLFKTYQIDISTWDISVASLVLTVCLSTCTTAVSFIMAAWQVWHLWTLPMVVIFFMGSISTVTLLEL